MTAAVHAEDHRGGDDAPAAVTAEQYGEIGSPERLAWLEKIKRLPDMVRGNAAIAEMFKRRPGDGPFTCDDDGKPIT